MLSLSAFKDPLTGEQMKISQADLDKLNDPATLGLRIAPAPTGLKGLCQPQETDGVYAGAAWAKKHGFDFAGKAGAPHPAAVVPGMEQPR